MIRMSLEHLLKRYQQELDTVMNDPRQDVLLTLDQHESVAIESAKTLYGRVQALQTQGGLMTPDAHQRVIDELQTVIDETQATIDRFEASGMSESMPEDYDKLLSILDSVIKQQREHTQGMLSG
ncbi:hypothetical protein AAGW18_21395 [Vreelandella titanicae]|uniref:hypothetical protein n=1 Tax=Vreelandella titanicae TaxID=664683 RepID=UPI001FCC4A58|nr:hypothetical protein [Halomonas titanicae]